MNSDKIVAFSISIMCEPYVCVGPRKGTGPWRELAFAPLQPMVQRTRSNSEAGPATIVMWAPGAFVLLLR
jgi:hypothetical protein